MPATFDGPNCMPRCCYRVLLNAQCSFCGKEYDLAELHREWRYHRGILDELNSTRRAPCASIHPHA